MVVILLDGDMSLPVHLPVRFTLLSPQLRYALGIVSVLIIAATVAVPARVPGTTDGTTRHTVGLQDQTGKHRQVQRTLQHLQVITT